MNMLADFFTKPLQGSTFKKMWSIILNMPDTNKANAQHRSVLENGKMSYKNVNTKLQKYIERNGRRKSAETR